jgi:hypothetical protein
MQKTAQNVSLWGEMTEICQKSLRDAPWMATAKRRLPGVQPLDMADWLVVDDAYAAQMAERARLLLAHRADVLRCPPEATAPAQELYDLVLAQLAKTPGFELHQNRCRRPDGVEIALDRDRSLEVLCHLIVEDLCILQKRGDEHVLTAALLCFPASWSLAQKIGHPLSHIHGPVDSYGDDMARRVQRLFDAVRPGRPLWRANALLYPDAELYQPRREEARRDHSAQMHILRSERQSILRLPKTDAVVFSIQTRQVRLEDLTAEQRAGLSEHSVEAVL